MTTIGILARPNLKEAAPVLRELAGLEKQVMLVGQGSHFELWSMEGWRRQMDHALAPGNALPASLENFSL